MNRISIWVTLLLFSFNAPALSSLSYSGRLVNSNGSPVSGPVNLKFDLGYTNSPTSIICSKTLNNVPLSNGVFHTKLDYSLADCGGTNSLLKVMSSIPAGESVAVQVTDLTNTKTYAHQAIYSVPFSMISHTAKNLDQMSATPGQVLKWDGTKWSPSSETSTSDGTVKEIQTGTGLSGGPITETGTISIANSGVGSAQLADGAITNTKVATNAGISRSKLATGSSNHILVNDASGVMSSIAVLPLSMGGTGATTVAGMQTALGLGTAALADIGTGAGNVMGADAVPTCFNFEKLQMSAGPLFAWTCVNDAVEDASKLPLAGGTMAGNINMDGNRIANLSSPAVGSDAATKAYVDDNEASNKIYVDDHTIPRIPTYKIRSYLQSKENASSTGLHADNCGGNEVYVMIEGLVDPDGDPITDMGFCIEATVRSAESWENARLICMNESKRLPREFEWQLACERGYLTDAGEDWEWASPFTLFTTKGNYYAVSSSPVTGECSHNFWYLPSGPSNSRNSLKFRCVK